ncbi:MAG: hypothetical protein HFH91_11455 [Lachnospiraceae bacterium]|nr:hypothetical protein [Lachnospiraceae bacterium]
MQGSPRDTCNHKYITGFPEKSLFSPGVHTELREQKSRSRQVSLIQGSPAGNARMENSGTSARVYENGVYGFSSIAECSGDGFRSADYDLIKTGCRSPSCSLYVANKSGFAPAKNTSFSMVVGKHSGIRYMHISALSSVFT